MAYHENATTLIGNVGREPELTTLNNGSSKLTFGLVRNDRRKDGDQWVDGPAQWFNVTMFGNDAERYIDSIHKGDRVVVIGESKYREWEKDGQKRSAIEVRAAEIAVSAKFATVTAVKRGQFGGFQQQPQQSFGGGFNAASDEAPF